MITDFLGIAIVGVALSVIIEIIQKKFGTGSSTTKGITVVLAIAVGVVYTIFQDTVYWQTILGVLGSASTVYALVFSQPKTE